MDQQFQSAPLGTLPRDGQTQTEDAGAHAPRVDPETELMDQLTRTIAGMRLDLREFFSSREVSHEQ